MSSQCTNELPVHPRAAGASKMQSLNEQAMFKLGGRCRVVHRHDGPDPFNEFVFVWLFVTLAISAAAITEEVISQDKVQLPHSSSGSPLCSSSVC
mmetsp:Transcript_7635/g.21653  ORF Transcript_7635/g.21653 Transcript_7635/m.21653 type:complete len:95 (+) Transcript_7635:1082-1366(+)